MPGDHLLVSGPNGAGKSTLLAVLAGRLTPSGLVRRRVGLTIGLLLADELEQALGTTPGTTVLATHDRWLRTRCLISNCACEGHQ